MSCHPPAGAPTTTYRVIFADTDAGGIVYHPRYLEIAERGRNECMRRLGLDIGALFGHRNLGLALRSLKMRFHRPAQFDDRLTIRTTVEKLGAAGSVWVNHILREGTQICTVHAEIICMDRCNQRPIPYPRDVLHIFARAQSRGADPARATLR